ncbi:uncharacterized protein LOC128239920 isoform X2 [Mya arenaria]|nr:uncharacterized protein LOC128239920 isoform X2 [Mya arenaria]
MKPENYHAFKKWCYSFTLSAMNWYRETVQDPDSGQTFSLLAVGNRIGGVIVWRVRMPCTDESDCSVVYRMHDGRERKVSSLKWSKQGYLAVGYVDGPVHLLQFDVKHPKNAPTMIELYTDSDQLAVADMTFIYNEQMNRQCLLAAKEHCQLVFILESGCDPHQLKLVSKSHVFGENLFPSTGFYVLDECSAVVVSQDRMSQKITLDWEKSEASISTVDTNVAGKREYICVGVAHSVNQALIIHVLRPKAGSDIHAAQFKMKATNLHVQSFADIPHEITPKQSVDCKLEDTSEKLGNLLDSLELFRRSVLANYPVDISMDCSSVEKLLSCVQLKRYAAAVHLHKLSDKLRGQIFPTQMSLDEEQKQDEVFKQFTTQVVIINLCLSLDNYLTWKTTQPQTQADGSHIVQLMCEFIQDNIQNYPQIKQAFPDIEEKIKQLQTDTAAQEDVKCCICPSNLKLENMAWVCPNGHVYVMCSKTLLPCEFLDYKMCNICKSNCRPESADVQWLAGDPLRCTFCESLMFCT